MRKIGNFEFPETGKEVADWQPQFFSHALHRNVLLIAKTRIEGEWTCYCTPVPGLIHDEEICLWERRGTKTNEQIARAAFPQFEGIPYAK